mmetsp:Transcript_25204/g.55866  ORF Transcript_25204/g.55866 Transcript_25204/m.55866 type:complete len:410 (-) Transcript_25204:1776-3005(-)
MLPMPSTRHWRTKLKASSSQNRFRPSSTYVTKYTSRSGQRTSLARSSRMSMRRYTFRAASSLLTRLAYLPSQETKSGVKGFAQAPRTASRMATQTSRRSWSGDEIPSNMRWKTVSLKVRAVSLRAPACVRWVMETRSRSSSKMSWSLASMESVTALPCNCTCSDLRATSMRENTICWASSACAMLTVGPTFGSGSPPTVGEGFSGEAAALATADGRASLKASYTRSWWGGSPPALGLRGSGRSEGYLPPPWAAWSTYSCPASLARRRARNALARVSSISLRDRSADTFSTSRAPRSTLSLAHTCTICSIVAWSEIVWASRVRRWLQMATLRGSLQVATAKLPTSVETIRCAPSRRICSLGSAAKSFSSRCLVVVVAMPTLRSTADCRISRMPRSTAAATRRRWLGLAVK